MHVLKHLNRLDPCSIAGPFYMTHANIISVYALRALATLSLMVALSHPSLGLSAEEEFCAKQRDDTIAYEGEGGSVDFKLSRLDLSRITICFAGWTLTSEKASLDLPDKGNGKGDLFGAVTLRRPGVELKGDSGALEYLDNRITFVRLIGTPVTFKQRVNETEDLTAQADIAEYDFEVSVRLVGNVLATGEGVQIASGSLVYDIKEQKISAEKADYPGSKVQMKIDPKKLKTSR
jgi:lipopolysaccharide transport protein LptA